MNIIPKQPNSSGAYGQVHYQDITVPPDTHYEITCDYSEYFNGFIIPTFENGKVTSYVCNTEAWEAWKASFPSPQPPQPTETEKLRADVDFIAMETGVSL